MSTESEATSGGADGAAAGRPNYWEYLRVEELLSLQGGLEGDESHLSDHEVLFIVVHQVYELWFKVVLRELVTARDLLDRDPVPDQELSVVVSGLRRVREILDQSASHFRVMETLSTRDFLDFRDKLLPASGFQSAQLREMEILLGLDDDQRIPLGGGEGYLAALRDHDGGESPALRRVMARREDRPTLVAALDAWLHRTPIRGSSPGDAGDREVVDGFVQHFLSAHTAQVDGVAGLAGTRAGAEGMKAVLADRYAQEREQTRAFLAAEDVVEEERPRRARIRAALLFIETYRELPLLAWPREFLESLIEVEQAFVIFRQRHARMVEREIGRRIGTGGSAGVAYLDETATTYRVFRDLWAVRTILMPRAAAPAIEQGDFYGFRHGVD